LLLSPAPRLSSATERSSDIHHDLPYLDPWIAAVDVGREKKSPLFRSVGRGDRVSEKTMSRLDVLVTIKPGQGRPALVHVLPHFSHHGYDDVPVSGGTLEDAQTASPTTSPAYCEALRPYREETDRQHLDLVLCPADRTVWPWRDRKSARTLQNLALSSTSRIIAPVQQTKRIFRATLSERDCTCCHQIPNC
jgi:hypothetical protein